MQEKIWDESTTLDYKEIINFNQFGITGFNWTMLVYGSMLQEWINVAGLLQSEGIWVDMFWIWNYKQNLSFDLIQSLENQDKVFIIWDFLDTVFKDFIYSKFYDAGIVKEDIYFITPNNTDKQVIEEYLSESVEMEPVKIYERVRKEIE
jgi:deoxyxylulose-5-phosphate synthase